MKKFYLFLCFTVVCVSTVVAQEVKLKNKERDETYEEYYVLVSDKKVKHGSYLKLTKPLLGVWHTSFFSIVGNYQNGVKHGRWEQYYPNCNQIKFKGFYKNNLKDSLWIYYYPDQEKKEIREVKTDTGTEIQIVNLNDRVSAKGHYKNNSKTGIWEYYDMEQRLLQRYDFDNDSLLFHNEFSDLQNKPLSFIGGEYHMNESFNDLFNFKETMEKIHTKINLNSGVITIMFEVDKHGKITKRKVIRDDLNNQKLLNQSLVFMDQLNDCWSPEYKNGAYQDSMAKIHFKLDVEKTTEHYISAKWSSGSTYIELYLNIEFENITTL